MVITPGGRDEEEGSTPRGRPRILLASRSPRRRDLLREHGFEFELASCSVDDGALRPGNASDPRAWVMSLALLKASAAVGDPLASSGRMVVLGADTVCVRDGQIIGQPEDEAHARRMVRLLADGEHEVLTGVALICPGTLRREIYVERSVVRVGVIEDAHIDEYLATGRWRGKAGAYNLAERQRAGWPLECVGDPTSVMGLPMATLDERLRA
ncbi:MAG: Maf family protein, partial [Phycisphaerales bacterium JB059]